MCEMGKNQAFVVVLRIRPKFWQMIAMGVNYNHTKFEQETQGGGQKRGSQLAGFLVLGFKICQK